MQRLCETLELGKNTGCTGAPKRASQRSKKASFIRMATQAGPGRTLAAVSEGLVLASPDTGQLCKNAARLNPSRAAAFQPREGDAKPRYG